MQHSHNQPPFDSISPEAAQRLAELQEGFHIVRAHDCTPQILSREFRSAYGLGLEAEHLATIEAIGDKIAPLEKSEGDTIQDTEASRLLENKPAFFELTPSILSDELQTAGQLFNADAAGTILIIAYTKHQFYGGKIESFPAIKKDDEVYRILQTTRYEEDIQSDGDREQQLNLIALPTKIKTEGDFRYAAMRFVEHDGHPKSITQEEVDDWIERFVTAGLDVGSDIGPEDESLDNFIRYQGRLYWCDGDVIAAHQFTKEEQHYKTQKMKKSLQQFVR